MAYTPNEFLFSREGHGREVGVCFCSDCRDLRLDNLVGVGMEEARFKFFDFLPLKRGEKLDCVFQLTCEQILYGEYYKRNALLNETHNQFKRWARKEFPQLSEKELENFATKINYASQAYRNWEQIVVNLTSPYARWIDAREFSVERFARSDKLPYVINLNTSMKPKGKMPADTEKVYSEDSYKRLLDAVYQDGILAEVDFNPQVASSVFHRLQSDVTNHCLRQEARIVQREARE